METSQAVVWMPTGKAPPATPTRYPARPAGRAAKSQPVHPRATRCSYGSANASTNTDCRAMAIGSMSLLVPVESIGPYVRWRGRARRAHRQLLPGAHHDRWSRGRAGAAPVRRGSAGKIPHLGGRSPTMSGDDRREGPRCTSHGPAPAVVLSTDTARADGHLPALKTWPE